MLMNITSGWQGLTKRPISDIVILVACLRDLATEGVPFVFSDRNATLETAEFFADLDQLNELPWALWRTSDFKRDDAQPDKIERYHAEALIYRELPVEKLECIACSNEARTNAVEQIIAKHNLQLPVYCRPEWYC